MIIILKACALLFLIGLWGIFVARKNLIITLMSIELILLSINLTFIFNSLILDDMIGQLFALLVLTVAAAEAAIGLAILIAFYRIRGVINVDFINSIKG
jgi:NADH-quinone oxidoreductase subunit K